MGPHVNGVCAIDTGNAWAAVDNDLMLKTIDEKNWTEYKIPSAVGNGFYLISVITLDMDHLWVAGETFDPGNILGEILHTDDGGMTWENQDMPVDAMIHRVPLSIHPNDQCSLIQGGFPTLFSYRNNSYNAYR